MWPPGAEPSFTTLQTSAKFSAALQAEPSEFLAGLDHATSLSPLYPVSETWQRCGETSTIERDHVSLRDPPRTPSPFQYQRSNSSNDSFRFQYAQYSPFRPATSASHRAQREFTRAILSSLSLCDDDPHDHTKHGVRRMSWNLWGIWSAMGLDDEDFDQMKRYNETFKYLARLYQNSINQSQPRRTEQIVRRGKEILAAMRLLAGQEPQSSSGASGIDPRCPSRVSRRSWAPARETALAEMVSERRKLRALEASLLAKESKQQPRLDLDTKIPELETHSTSTPILPTDIPLPITWAERELEKSIRRRARSVQRVFESLQHPIKTTVTRPKSVDLKDKAPVGKEVQMKPFADLKNSILEPHEDSKLFNDKINWRYPEYNNILGNSRNRSDSEIEGHQFNAAAFSHSPHLLQAFGIRSTNPGETARLASHFTASYGISPKTSLGPLVVPKNELTDDKVLIAPVYTSLPPFINTSNRDQLDASPIYHRHLTASIRSRFRRFKTEVKKVSSPVLRGFRELRSSSSSSQPSENVSATTTEATMTPPPSRSRTYARMASAMKRSRIMQRHPIANVPPMSPQMATHQVALMDNRVTFSEILVPDTPTTLNTTWSMAGDEKFTRTEKEYQDLLRTLHQLKRELRFEKALNRKDSRFKISRGRKLERGSEERRASTGGVTNRETVETWLGQTPL
ncbi:hypothetical protein EX30DRAFT_363891 [Ascodesmis nigricans]|uniref:Uncharacterized protein n=1 Tax=Ascodesmis nigricans TaxID=341454 RepID=A0A4S2MX70_9PEZI|nr:hypothetical protein EX30DRAFT_363891 [Ascodesmis nigricans]